MSRSLAPTALMLGNVVTGLAIMSPTGMLGDLAKGLGVSVYQAGLLITFGAAVLCVGSPMMTWLTSRIDRRLLLAGTMLVVGVCHLALMAAPDYAALLAVRLVMLAIAALFTPIAAGTASQIVPEARRAGTIVYVFLGWSLAFAFGMPVITFTAAHVGWRETLGGIGALALVVAVLIAIFLPKGLVGASVDLRTWLALARNRMVLLLLSITTLQIAGQFAVFAYLAPLLTRIGGATPEIISLSFMIYGVCGFLGNLFAMRIVGPFGPFRTSVFFMMSLLAGSMLWTLGAGLATLWVLLAASVPWGFGFAAMNSMQQARLVAAAPASANASVALNTSVLYVGQAIGSGLGGAFFAREQIQGNGYAAVAFIALALVVLWRTRPVIAAATVSAAPAE